jgi:hypothetical protein
MSEAAEIRTCNRVSRFSAAYMVSRFPDREPEPAKDIEMSGSNLSLANSLNDISHSGVSLAILGFKASTRYFRSELATWSSAQAEKMDIFTMTMAFALRPLNSPMEALSGLTAGQRQTKRLADLPEKDSKEDDKRLSILVICLTSVTMPADTKVAQTFKAAAASSGDESDPNAGLRAELICAWCC